MKKDRRLLMVLLVAFMITYSSRNIGYAAAKIPIKLTDIKIRQLKWKTRVTITTTKPIEYTYFEMKSPPRLLINLVDKNVYSVKREVKLVEKGALKKIRFNYISEKAKPGLGRNLEYIVFELTQSTPFQLSRKGNSMILDINVPPEKHEKDLTGDRERIFPKKVVTDISGITGIGECVRIALDNSVRGGLAEEELELSRLKSKEARRALFPSVAVKYEETRGDAKPLEGISSFRDRNFGLQLGIPIYQGGKLTSILKQSELQQEMTEKNLRKIKQGIIFETKKAYYNVVKHQKNLRERQSLFNEAKSALKAVKKRFKLGLSTKLELLTVESLYHQTYYQLISTEKDFSLAMLSLQQLMGLELLTPIQVDTKLNYKDLGIKLNTCLYLAMGNRTEIKLNKLSVKFKKYGNEISRSAGRLKIDFTGFIGQSSGGYTNEDDYNKLKDNWSVGVKASKTFGTSTLSATGIRDVAAPKTGESDRKGSQSGQVLLSFLDNYKLYSDKKQGSIQYKKSFGELAKAGQKVTYEVRNAFFNYEKSLVQIKAISKEIELNKEELKIIKTKKKLNMAQGSDVLRTKIKLASSRTSYTDALVFHNISIAKLNQAIALVDYFHH
ncbi:TolC family protein [bacterium]|nr:TolC family protein [bacterium]